MKIRWISFVSLVFVQANMRSIRDFWGLRFPATTKSYSSSCARSPLTFFERMSQSACCCGSVADTGDRAPSRKDHDAGQGASRMGWGSDGEQRTSEHNVYNIPFHDRPSSEPAIAGSYNNIHYMIADCHIGRQKGGNVRPPGSGERPCERPCGALRLRTFLK